MTYNTLSHKGWHKVYRQTAPVGIIGNKPFLPSTFDDTIPIWKSETLFVSSGKRQAIQTIEQSEKHLAVKAFCVFMSTGVIFLGIAIYAFCIGNEGIGVAALGPLLASLVGMIGFRNWKRKDSNPE
jgi:hypothetical protein